MVTAAKPASRRPRRSAAPKARQVNGDGGTPVRKSVKMLVSKEDEFYLARAAGLSIFTQARTLNELKRNIREAVALHLEGGEHKKYGLPRKPKIEVVYDFSETL